MQRLIYEAFGSHIIIEVPWDEGQGVIPPPSVEFFRDRNDNFGRRVHEAVKFVYMGVE